MYPYMAIFVIIKNLLVKSLWILKSSSIPYCLIEFFCRECFGIG